MSETPKPTAPKQSTEYVAKAGAQYVVTVLAALQIEADPELAATIMVAALPAIELIYTAFRKLFRKEPVNAS